MIRRIISGGQIGADIAAVRAAHVAGVETGGQMPLGFRQKGGSLDQDEAVALGFTESWTWAYPPRTEQNVVDSDGTLRLAVDFHSPGEILTKDLCEKHGRPVFDVDLAQDGPEALTEILAWVRANGIEVLNVAGNAKAWLELPVMILVEQLIALDRRTP